MCVSVSAFDSLVGIPVDITSFAAIQICSITVGIKTLKKRDQIISFANTKINTKEFFISDALIDSNINHDQFVSGIDVLKKYYDMKEEIKCSNKHVQYNQENGLSFISA